MEKDFNHSDKLMQEKLQNFSMAPPAEAWGAIEKAAAGKGLFRSGLFYLSAASVIIITVLSIIYFYPDNAETKTSSKNQIDNQELNESESNNHSTEMDYSSSENDNNSASINQANENSDLSEENISNENDSDFTTKNTSSNVKNENSSNKNTSGKNSSHVSSSNVTASNSSFGNKTKNEINVPNKNSNVENKSAVNNTQTSNNTSTTVENKKSESSGNKSNNNTSNTVRNEQNKSQTNGINNIESNNNKVTTENTNNNLVSTENNNSSLANTENSNVATTTNENNNLLEKDSAIAENTDKIIPNDSLVASTNDSITSPKNKAGDETKIEQPKYSKFSMEGGLSGNTFSYRAGKDNPFNNFNDILGSSVSNKIGYEVFLRGYYHLNPSYSFYSGLEFNLQKSQLNYQESEVNMNLTTDTTGWYFDTVLQQQVPITTTTWVPVTTWYDRVSKNKEQIISIPLGFVYSLMLNPKNTLSVNFSSVFSLRMKTQGLVLTAPGEVTPMQDVYKKSFLISLRLGIRYERELTSLQRSSLFIEPYFGYGMNNRASNSLTYSINWRNTGVFVGYKKYF